MPDLQSMRKLFQKVLLDESQHRNVRHGKELEINGEALWVVKEREAMFNTLTQERAKLGKGPVPITELMRAERLAYGHIDYAEKFSLGCAELVFKEELGHAQ